MRSFSKRDKIKAFIATKMTDIITFLDNNGKYSVLKGVNFHGLYRYLEMIGAQTTFTTPVWRSYHFGHSYYINNYTAYIQTFIAAL